MTLLCAGDATSPAQTPKSCSHRSVLNMVLNLLLFTLFIVFNPCSCQFLCCGIVGCGFFL